jgi:hypothetical protein
VLQLGCRYVVFGPLSEKIAAGEIETASANRAVWGTFPAEAEVGVRGFDAMDNHAAAAERFRALRSMASGFVLITSLAVSQPRRA